MSEQTMRIPGLINAWPSVENQAVALNFEPNFLGALAMALAIALIYALMKTLLASRRADSPSTL